MSYRKAYDRINLLPPVNRGNEFEKLFNKICEDAGILIFYRFRTSDTEQEIDGAVLIYSRVFLLEAKWEDEKTLAASKLYSILGKINSKIDGTLGIFISHNELKENFINAFRNGIKQNCILIHGKSNIEDIIDGEFTQSKDNLFLERMINLKKTLKNCLSKEEKTKGIIAGIKSPVIWEKITMIFNGDTLKIKQDNFVIGEYTLMELGFPKIKTERTVTGLFYSLFVRENQPKNNLLLSTDNKNQKIKSNLSKILCNAFNTNIDPISID